MPRLEPTPIRVVHVVPSLERGGMENGVVNLIASADRARVSHAVICLERAGALAARLPAGVPLVVAGKAFGNDPRTILRTARATRRLRADVVHARSWATLVEGALAARLAGAKLVHGIHGRTHDELGSLPWKRRLLERRLVALAERVVVLLPGLREEALALGVSPDKVRVLENGVDGERFSPDTHVRARTRGAIGVGPFEVCVGCVGRLDPVKDHATLLRALTRLPEEIVLVVAGGGPLRESLERLAGVEGLTSKRVRFLGDVADPSTLYPAFDVFALPSLYEGSSNTVLEAMASGVPVVATRTGGTAELVSRDTGFLVSPGDANALGGALKTLANDPSRRRAMGKAARRRALERSLPRMVRAYESLYEEIAGRAGERRELVSPPLPALAQPLIRESERRALPLVKEASA